METDRKNTDPQDVATESLYDTQTEESDLWFLPADPEEDEPALPPLPRAPRGRVSRAADWTEAESGLARALADAAAQAARLDQVVEDVDPAIESERIAGRLALVEVAGLSWAEGRRLTPDRIALYLVLRLSAADEDHRDLALAEWACSRLMGPRDPYDPEAFLGRARVEDDGLGDLGKRPVGQEFHALADTWRMAVQGADLHPISRAAFGFHLWRGLGLSGFEGMIEPAVVAARIGGLNHRALPFLPFASAGVQALTAGGAPEAKLALWYRGVSNACRAARLELDRLTDWHQRACEGISDLSGRTPRGLIDALLGAPVLSAAAAEKLTGASRAAVQRNLDLLVRRGLAHEITGQSRYRFWKADL